MSIAAIASQLIGPVSSLISEFVEDKDKANELAVKVSTLAAEHGHAERIAQLRVNQQEAAHKSLFVAGWRPAVGWVCVLALFNNYIVIPYVPDAQAMSLTELLPVLGGMLGLSFNRTQEKRAGVSRER
jgi:hypothetical protein